MGAGQYYSEQAAKQTLAPGSLFADPMAANNAAPPQAPNALTATSGLTPGQIANRDSILRMAAANHKQAYQRSDGYLVIADPGLPQDAIDRGITTTGDYQQYSQNQIADRQIAAAKEIAAQGNAFNERQLAETKAIRDDIQRKSDEQAERRNVYMRGQTSALGDASTRINEAFGGFTDDYFSQYVRDWMAQAGNELGYNRGLANKGMLFGLARQGLSDSQELANQTGILDEAQGKAIVDETGKAQSGAATLRANIGAAKKGLLGQVAEAQAIAPPIETGTIGDVNNALDLQNRTISGIATGANDVAASLKAVPTVSPMGNVFTGLLGGAGGYMSGVNNQNSLAYYYGGVNGTNPGSSRSTSVTR